jgi:hypothetical protein
VQPELTTSLKLLDVCSDLRVHTIRQARAEVASMYGLRDPRTRPLTATELVEDFKFLLKDTKDACLPDLTIKIWANACIQEDSPRFTNAAIAGVLTRCFYTNGLWGIGYINSDSSGLKNMSGNTMGLIGAILYHAISEYNDEGGKKTIAFHGHLVESRLGSQLMDDRQC